MTQQSAITVVLLTIVTLGIYGLIWFVRTKREMVKLGADIPTSWLLIVPIANLIWVYKYCMGIEHITKGKTQGLMMLLLYFLIPIVAIYIYQEKFNQVAQEG